MRQRARAPHAVARVAVALVVVCSVLAALGPFSRASAEPVGATGTCVGAAEHAGSWGSATLSGNDHLARPFGNLTNGSYPDPADTTPWQDWSTYDHGHVDDFVGLGIGCDALNVWLSISIVYGQPSDETDGADGGWWVDPHCQIYHGGVWHDRDCTVSPSHSDTAPVAHSVYTFTIDEPYTFGGGANGIRVAGAPGGEDAYVAVAEIIATAGEPGDPTPTPTPTATPTPGLDVDPVVIAELLDGLRVLAVLGAVVAASSLATVFAVVVGYFR